MQAPSSRRSRRPENRWFRDVGLLVCYYVVFTVTLGFVEDWSLIDRISAEIKPLRFFFLSF